MRVLSARIGSIRGGTEWGRNGDVARAEIQLCMTLLMSIEELWREGEADLMAGLFKSNNQGGCGQVHQGTDTAL